jgi:hypothetical protein
MRRNPGATVGMAALVTFGFMLVPIAFSLVVGLTGQGFEVTSDDTASAALEGGQLVVGAVGGGVFGWLASVVVTGLKVPVTEHALVGIRLSAADAWRRSRGRLPRLLGLSLLTLLVSTLVVGLPIGAGVVVGLVLDRVLASVLLGILGGLLGLVATVFLFVRLGLLSPPALVAERRGVFSSLGRAWRLSSPGAWRLFGIYLLASVAASLVGQVLGFPLGILGGIGSALLPDGWGPAVLLLSSNLASILTGAVVGPFTGGVVTLLYFDQRFRQEGLDIELLQQVQSGGRR